MAGPLEPADYVYFGEHAYPLAQHWLEQQVQKSKQTYEAHDICLTFVHKAYWTMLGMYAAMPHQLAQVNQDVT